MKRKDAWSQGCQLSILLIMLRDRFNTKVDYVLTSVLDQHFKASSDWSNIILSNQLKHHFCTSNERVHLLVIELKHHIFGFKGRNIERLI